MARRYELCDASWELIKDLGFSRAENGAPAQR